MQAETALFSGLPPVIHPTNHKDSHFAILETVTFLSVMVLVDYMFGSGTRFMDMGLHPFWIIVLMVTLQYGPNEAIAAAVLSSVFLLAGNIPEQHLTETMYEYILRISFLPFLWIITALILGSIRSRQLQEKRYLQEQLKISEEGTDIITKAYTSMKQRKEQLELRLAEERCSVLTVYKVAKTLDTADAVDALKASAELVRVALNPGKFSLYRWKDSAFRLEAMHGWEKTDKCYATEFPAASPLARVMLEKKRLLSIIHDEDEKILAGQGMLAAVIRDDRTGKIFGMLKIEEMNFMEMGSRTHDIFQVTCDWIAHIYAKVERAEASAAADRRKHSFADPLIEMPSSKTTHRRISQMVA